MADLLVLEGIEKRFGGIHALKNVSLRVPENTIYGLIGPNGAGKTTLFNVITGLYEADSGLRMFRGKALPLTLKPHEILQRGIARTFQNIRLFNEMTALENIMVGRHHLLKNNFITDWTACTSNSDSRLSRPTNVFTHCPDPVLR